jgi:DNA-binding HxlR family transcriptional regulator
MMAREEITILRQERDRLREAVRQQLGQQLDQVSSRQLTERIAELTNANRRLERDVAQLQPLKDRVHELEKDLAAARTSLLKMIRAENS